MRKRLIVITSCLLILFGVLCGAKIVHAENGSDDEEALPLYIKAINPGYKIDNISNVGEMVEIRRNDRSNAPLSLAGTVVGYTNSSGNYSILFEFPENSWMTGESILLRLASSPYSELADVNYKKTLAMTGGLVLINGEEVLDRVCWLGEKKTMNFKGETIKCNKEFSSDDKSTLVWNEENGKWEHLMTYDPKYVQGSYFVTEDSSEDDGKTLISQCKGMEFTEILGYYETAKSEQFIELHNSTAEQILLNGCKIKYKNKKYTLSGVVEADGYFVYRPEGFSLTKNPVNSNEIKLIDVNEEEVDTVFYLNGQKKGTSFALIGYDKNGEEIWKATYAPTPGEPNNYQEFKTCENGKVINKATGNCVKVASVSEKICKDGYYLNILTGRCKKKETAAEKTCKEGYYLNLETNRCRKVQNNDGADYSLEPEEYEDNSSFVALGAIGIVIVGGASYLIYEFRNEIRKLFRKVFR